MRPNRVLASAGAVVALLAGVTVTAAPAAAVSSVRLMTYNIAHLTLGSLDAIADDIAASGADVVALQETKQDTGDVSDGQKLIDILGWGGDGLQHSYFAGWTDTSSTTWCSKNKSCTEGNAIISKYPIVGTGVIPLYYETGLHRNLIRATVQVDSSTQLRVYATHLASVGEDYAKHQLSDIASHIAGTAPTSQFVLLGDLNLTWTSASIANGDFTSLTSRGYHDWKADRIDPANPCSGPYGACTYPAAGPTDKRDYVWVHGYSMTAGSRIDNCASSCTSDHRGYWTTIAL